MEKDEKKWIRRLLWLILGVGVYVGGYFCVIEILEGDPDDDPRFLRDVRIDSWSALIGDDRGILAVQQKLIELYGENAPKIKVDMANPDFSEGNWHYEFYTLAQEAEARGDFFGATGYYSIASYPHLLGDSRANEMYALGLEAFKEALSRGNYSYQVLDITVDGATIPAFLVLPQNRENERVPVVITTGGIDGLMTFCFSDYLNRWNEEGIAWVGFDMHGHGTSHEIPITAQAFNIHEQVVHSLQNNPHIDEENIFIYGRSWGGYAGLRMLTSGRADQLNVAGIAVSPVGEKLFNPAMLWYKWLTLGQDTKAVWSARLEIPLPNYIRIIQTTNQMGLALDERNFWGDYRSSIPLLVMNTAEDEMNPVSEVIEMADLSTNGSYFIAEDEEGHCPSRPVALAQVGAFVEQNRR